MMNRLDQLEDAAARETAQAYLAELDDYLSTRRKRVREDVRSGVEAHLLEALSHDASASQVQLEEAVKALGSPDTYAGEWADAVEAGHPPGRVEEGLTSLRSRSVTAAKSVAAILFAVSGFLAVLGVIGRLVAPEAVGLFVLADGEILVGTWAEYQAPIERDVLGLMTAPTCAVIAVIAFALAWFSRPAATKK